MSDERALRLVGRLRRGLFAALVLGSAGLATWLFTDIRASTEVWVLDLASSALFAILFLWLAHGFWTGLLGATAWLTGGLRLGPGDGTARPDDPPLPPTAILMPVYNEDPARVLAAVEAMHRSLLRTGVAGSFEWFVLSDTTDPEIWLAEEAAWLAARGRLAEDGVALHYRRRRRNTGRKAGNLADFCRRWGGRYECLIVLDADSVMGGDTMVRLARLMARNPQAGIVQVPPMPASRGSLFARLLQFSAGVYGPLFFRGAAFWWLDQANYVGHNAILRTRAFAECCGLPPLRGRPPLGGEIMSHDFVEAALMRRAGWEVWLAPELGQSFEEPPPTLLDFLRRDRRWMQGNLQHLKLLGVPRLRPVSRLHLLSGALAYLSAPLWFAFLIVTLAQALVLSGATWDYFPEGALAAVFPVDRSGEALALFAAVMGMLHLPKLLGLLFTLADRGSRRAHGGAVRLGASFLLECLLAALIAPVLMLAHTVFTLQILIGRAVGWSPQRRTEPGGAVAEAIRAYLGHTVLGLGLAWLSLAFLPGLFWWLSPLLAGLVLAMPLAMALDSRPLGQAFRRAGLLLSAAETEPPRVLAEVRAAAPAPPPADPFGQVVADPVLNAAHVALLAAAEPPGPGAERDLAEALERLRAHGWAELSRAQRLTVLGDAAAMRALHWQAWSEGDPPLAA